MGFITKITKASSISNSYRTTVPAAIITQFDLGEGDQLEWVLKAKNGEILIMVKPERSRSI